MQTCQIALHERCAPVTIFVRRRQFLFGATATGELGIPPLAHAVRLAAVCGLLLALAVPSVFAQTFQRVIGTSLEERSEWVDQTNDGGYIIAGIRRLSTDDVTYVGKQDPSGALVWEWLFNGPGFNISSRVVQTIDGGYAVASESSSVSPVLGILLFKLDSVGTLLWSRTYAGTAFIGGSSGGVALDETADSGFILTGRIQGTGNAQQAAVLLRSDATGIPQWQSYYTDLTFDNNTYASFADVHETPLVGGYIACGHVTNGVLGDRKSLMVKFDAAGAVVWAKTYGVDPSHDDAYGVDPAANGDPLAECGLSGTRSGVGPACTRAAGVGTRGISDNE